MFIKARPQEWVTSYYLINVAQITVAHDCLSQMKPHRGRLSLLLEFSDGQRQIFPGLSVQWLENTLKFNPNSPLIDALSIQETT